MSFLGKKRTINSIQIQNLVSYPMVRTMNDSTTC